MAIEYDLHESPSGALLEANINSGHKYSFTGTKDFYVKSRDEAGSTVDSNIDSGTGVWVAVMFDATITSPVEPTVNSVTGGTMVYDDNLDGTWHVYTADPVTGVNWLNNTDITGFVANAGNTLTTMTGMFYGCSGLTTLDVTSFGTAQVTTMNSMFHGCSGLTALDVTSFGTAQVTSMQSMFSGCSGLTSLDLTSFDTAQVTNMSGMFSGCSGLTALDVTSLDTAQVTIMSSMFSGCSGLTSLDLSPLDTAQVTTMSSMFRGCSGLTTLDLTSLDTAQVTSMQSMFFGCSGLTALDLTSFDTAQVTIMSSMFENCSNLTCISNINTTFATDKSNMFNNALALIQPDATAQADIADTDGANWVHPTTCP